jgi:DNA-binding PadR family transcriptional regulator
MRKSDTSRSESPASSLTEAAFFVLLSLANGQKHGYAILKDVNVLSDDRMHLSISTTYSVIGRLLDQGLIARVENETGSEEGQTSPGPGLPRKAYRITPAGRGMLQAERERLQLLVATADLRLGEEQA